MNKIYHIAKKNILLRFSSRSFLIFFLLLPVLFTFVLSSALAGLDDPRRTLLLTVEEETQLTASLVAKLESSALIRLEQLPRAEAEQALADESAPAWLIIPAGTTTAVQAGEQMALQLRKLPNNTDADALERTVTAVASRASLPLTIARNSVRAAELVDPFAEQAARTAYFDEARQNAEQVLDDQPQRLVVNQPATADGQASASGNVAQQSAGQMVTWVFITLLGAAVLFVMERQEGTLRRLLTTPTNKAIFFAGMMSGELVLGLVQMGILIGVGAIFLGVTWGNDPLALLLLLVSFALASVSLGTLLGVLSKTENQARNLSIMAGMTMALLGGCWWPLELFPEWMRTAVYVFPTTWAMTGLMDLLVRNAGVADVALNTAVLLGYALVFGLLGVWRMRFE